MDLVKMSAKGQLVVPDGIRAKAKFKPGDRFIAVAMDEGIMFRKVTMDEAWEEFRKFSGKLQESMKKRKIPRSTVDKAVKWARQKSS